MKKALLISLSLVISFAIFGQQKIKFKEGLKECRVIERVYTDHSSNGPLPKPIPASVPSGERAVVLRQMGTSANGIGMLSVRQNLWADPAINAVSFIHRMHVPPHGPGSGFLAYDLSLDGGETWTNNIQVYEAPSDDFNGRYPQGGFYNPTGNTDPDNAYQTYFAAVLDGSNNGTWGGYGYGVHKFSGTEPPTQHNVAATSDFLQGVPEAYTITSKGLAICVDPSNNGVGQPFADFFIITKGYFNPEIGDFEMDRFNEFMPAGGISPVSGDAAGVADSKST